MDLLEHAKHELELIEKGCKDEEELHMQRVITKDVLDVLNTLCDQGHSGFSASYIMPLIKTLWNWEPITPLTGEDSEWNNTFHLKDEPVIYQNARCTHVFKDDNGRAYDIRGIVYITTDGCQITCAESKVYIDFPYTPKTEYRKLLISEDIVPVKWANRLHLYKTVHKR